MGDAEAGRRTRDRVIGMSSCRLSKRGPGEVGGFRAMPERQIWRVLYPRGGREESVAERKPPLKSAGRRPRRRRKDNKAQLRLWETETRPVAGPFVKWAGGKTNLLPKLRIYYPHEKDYETYYEPFLGGGAVFFDIRPRLACLSDSNADLVNAFHVVKKDVESLINHLRELDAEYRKAPREKYYEVRDQWIPDELDSVERATRFIFLNKTCYNGLYRVNRQGKFNVPFGKYHNPTICDEDRLRAANDALRGAAVQCLDFQKALRQVGRTDFVYVDPPYEPISKTANFTGYTKEQFARNDQLDLLRELTRIKDEVGARVLMSSSGSKDIERLYRKAGFRVVHVTAPRAISSDPKTRGPTKELFIVS